MIDRGNVPTDFPGPVTIGTLTNVPDLQENLNRLSLLSYDDPLRYFAMFTSLLQETASNYTRVLNAALAAPNKEQVLEEIESITRSYEGGRWDEIAKCAAEMEEKVDAFTGTIRYGR